MLILTSQFSNGAIYLSGGMEYADNLGAGWRVECGARLRQMNYFPIDIAELDIAYQQEHGDIMGDIRFDTTKSENQRKASIRHHFIDTDLRLITEDSDALIVLYDESARRGAGTISECQHAFNNDVPIIVMSAWKDWHTELPSWLHALSTKVFTEWEDMYTYFDRLPEGILVKDQYGNHNSIDGDYYLCSLTGEPFKKEKHHFVSNVSPLYSKDAVEVVTHTHEQMKNRYDFFMEHIETETRRNLAGLPAWKPNNQET